MAYHQRNPTLHTNMNNQLDVGHIYRQARPQGPGPSGHPRAVYAPSSYQPNQVQQRFPSPTPNYVQYREGPPHSYRQQVPISHDTGQPCKLIRLHEPKPELQQPLRIDIRETSTAYVPQTEAISPTFPSEIDDDTVRATKEDLLQQINKVDREIAQTEQKINQLRTQQLELEAKASRPEGEQAAEKETECTVKHQSLAQKIYAENRKKAAESHKMFDHLGPKIEVPIYNQPSDSPAFQENQRKHALFRPHLIKHLQRRAAERHDYERQMTVTYNELMADWQKKVEKLEKKKPKDSKLREEFEKMFPELRKQREDKERFNRVGARVKSEADMEEILDVLHEQETEDKKMRSYAVVPPILLDPISRKSRYKNQNGIILDLPRLYKDNEFLNFWTSDEHDTFKEKYMQHPKNFGLISSYLEKKSVKDCVLHYYLSKKQEHYKQQLRKSRHGRTRASRNPAASKAQPAAVPETPAGVTTRLQREQLQKQDPSTAVTGPLVPAIPGPTVPAIAPTAPVPEVAPQIVPPVPVVPEVAPPPSQPTTAAIPTPMEVTVTTPPETTKKRRKGDKTLDDLESSEDETQLPTGPIGPHTCIVCKTLVDSGSQSRHLPRNHACQYGLNETDVIPGSRVCNNCRCKAVRSRLVCPLPTCPNVKGFVKRLRTIPSKWADLPSEVLEPIVRDFQIPTGTTKCCSTCYSRISRRITPHVAPGDDSLRWPDQDIEALKTALRKHGTGWSLVAELVPRRTRHQCKTFYFNCRKKYKLDAIVHEYYKTHFGEDRKPAVTDEEESGSSTSSCDEQPDAGMDTSDTASAGSPAKQSESSMASIGKENRAHLMQEGDQPSDMYPHLSGTSISAVGGPPSMSPPRTVEDLMANVIEKQLMKSPGGVALGCSGPPTITSILTTDATGFKRSVGESLATLSVVGQSAQQDFPKEQNPNVVVLSIASQSDRPPENETLDLSMKKREVTVEYSASNSVPHHAYPTAVHSKNNTVPQQREPQYYHPQTNKQPPMQTPHLVMTHSRGQLSNKDVPPGMPKLSPKVLPSSQSSKPGSITHGTPVQSQPRFENAIRQIPQSQHKEGGSITHGTPVHLHLPPGDKRQNVNYDYYKRSSPATATSTGFSSPYPPVRPPTSYNLEPQLSSRQIIINDYITSQQMHGPRRVPMSVSDKSDSRVMTQLYYSSPPNTMYMPSRSPAESATTPPLRQGVIQRHNTIPTSQAQVRSHGQPPGKVHYPPPGHEAFSSLVEAAVQQPSLPVPSNEKKSQYREHEGLGKTMADSITSSRIMEHNRMAGYPSAEQQHRMRQNQERDRMISQREHEQQRYQQAAREQRESHHHQQQQLQMQMQRQARIEQQNQQARLEQQARIEQQRMENARHEQQGPPRLDYEAKQQRHQQQLAAFMDAQQRATGEREREKERGREWERSDPSRIMMSNYPRERHMPPQRVSDSPSPSRAPANPQTAKSGPRNENDSTMTAASLIDAIITHQINQTSETGGPGAPSGPSQPRPGDRLFQSFPPPHAEPNGKVSPLKRSGSPLDREPVKNISLSDHIIDSIINKDFAASSYSMQYHHPQEEQQNWKMRRPEAKEQEQPREKTDERQIIRMAQPQAQPGGSKAYHEPVSPPEPWTGSRYYDKPSHLSPLDYVKSRIVEAMRTSEEKDGDEKPKDGSPPETHPDEERKPPSESPTTSSAYAFPYSTIGVHGVCVPPSKPPTDEPAPILSSKYEVLSDEDE